jgi:hypothetical protein
VSACVGSNVSIAAKDHGFIDVVDRMTVEDRAGL